MRRVKVVNLINLDTIGGVERLYRKWLLNTSINQIITLSDRYTIHNYIENDIVLNSLIYYTKKYRFVRLPKFLREKHVNNILRRESPDALVIWNKIDSQITGYIAGVPRVIYYDHGASWMATQEGVGSGYWDRIHKVVCVSNSAVKLLNYRFPSTTEIETDVIYNPNLMSSQWSETTPSQDPFKFGIASRVIARKGISIALDAIKFLLDEHINVHLYVAGEGKYLDKLKAYCQEINITEHVTWLGNIDDMKSFYNNIHVLLCPSIYEPFGLTVFESSSYGVPVIASDIDGIHEAVSSVGGQLITPKLSIEQYAKKYRFKLSEIDSLSYYHTTNTVAPSQALDPKDLYIGMKKMVVDHAYYANIKDTALKSLSTIPSISDWVNRLDKSILGL